MEETGFELEWLHEDLGTMAKNQATIITRMVLNRVGQQRYHLCKKFFGKGEKNDAIFRMLCQLKPPSNRTSARYEK